MIRSKTNLLIALAGGAVAAAIACSDSGTTGLKPSGSSNQGTVIVRLTDAPFSTDSVKSVDIWVVRVDARAADVDSAHADSALSDDSSSAQGWTTIASPNASFDLLTLQHGFTALLGQARLPVGTFDGFRLVIDPSKSSVTLKNGRVLSGATKPGIDFPSASHSGIKIVLSQPVVITDATTTLLVDFNVNDSFVMRGNSIDKNGLLFKPVIKATVTANLPPPNATVKLVNATDTTLNFLQNGSPVTGGSGIIFGASSSCASVSATNPQLSVTEGSSTTPLPGFAPPLVAGFAFSVVAFRDPTGVHFATLPDTFPAPPSGRVGLLAYNASGDPTALDVFATTPTATLGTPTFPDVASGGSSVYVTVPADSVRIRVTAHGTTTPVLIDLATILPAGKNFNVVIAPPASGTIPIRGFVAAGCSP